MKPAFIISGSGRINGVFKNKPFSVDADNPHHAEIVSALCEERFDDFESLLNLASHVVKYTEGKVTIQGNSVFYNGVELHNVLVDKILEFVEKKYPYKPLLAFLENLMQNPSKRAVDELYTFLVHKGLPITDDGCFLGYKGLRDDYRDIHSGTYLYSIGSVHEITRNLCDDNFGVNCSQGLHVGNYEYAVDFRDSYAHNGKLVMVKVNPKDVVSVPTDCSCQKLRTCRLEVVSDCTERFDNAYMPSKCEEDCGCTVGCNDDYEDDSYDDYEDEDYGDNNW